MGLPFNRRRAGVGRLAVCVACVCAAARAQVATSAAAFGAADPVVVSGTWTLLPAGPNAFDFGPRAVVFAPGALVATNGATIVAGALVRVEAGAVLTGAVAMYAGASAGEIVVAGTVDGTPAATGTDGGDVLLSAAGHVRVEASGVVRSRPGPGPGGRGGDVQFAAGGDVLVAPGAALDVGGTEPGHLGGSLLLAAAGSVDVARDVRTSADAWAGPFAIMAGGAATVVGDVDASGTSQCVFGPGEGGDVAIVAGQDVAVTGDVDASAAEACGGNAGDVRITTPADVALFGVVRARAGYGWHEFEVDAGGDFLHVGAVDVAGNSSFGVAGRGGAVDVQAGGTLTAPAIDARGGLDYWDLHGPGGPVTLVAGGALVVGEIDAFGVFGGPVALTSTGGDVTTAEIRTAADESPGFGVGGDVTVTAARDASIGAVDAYGSGIPGSVTATAGRHATLFGADLGSQFPPPNERYLTATAGGTLEIDGPIVYPACGGADVAEFVACRLRVDAPVTPHGGANTGATLRFRTGDALVVAAPIAALPGGAIHVETRLPAPHSPAFEGAGSALPAPTVLHQPTLPPCLALGFASLTATPVVPPLGVFEIVATGPPSHFLLTVVGTVPGPWPLGGALGFAQVSPIGFVALADPGVFGPPVPGSITDAAGRWAFATPVPPGLAGLALLTETFVIDVAAPNGLFHQPPAVATVFQ